LKLFVLAGGFGSRLRSVVSNVPKPMAPVGEVPFLYHQLNNWKSQGINEFLFLLYHQAEQIIDFLESEKHGILEGCTFEVVVEPEPLDTGGAVFHAIKQSGYQGVFLVTNADTWLGSDIQNVICASSPSIGVVQLEDCSRYGNVIVDGKSRVTAFQEKQDDAGPGLINAGLYQLDTSLFEHESRDSFSLERDFFPDLVLKEGLKAVKMDAPFIDIGVPADYQRFNNWFASGAKEGL